ncbi:ALQxL family class IV lanthipeptide [Streptosporangium sp. CA-135522]
MELDINALDMLPGETESALSPCTVTCVTLASLITLTLS